MTSRVRALAAAILLAGPTALAFYSGGFFDRPRLVAGLGAWALVVVVAFTAPVPLPRSAPARTAVIGLVLLAAWTAVSYEWAPIGDRTLADLQRLLLYLAVLVAGAAVFRDPRPRAAVEPALALGVFVVIAYGLSERLLPGLGDLHRSTRALGRLGEPITYWNAEGCLAAIGATLGMRLAADWRRPAWLRSAAGAASVPVLLGVFLSYSRGAIFAIAAGSAALVLLSPTARGQLRACLTVLGAGVVASVVAHSLPRVNALLPGQHGSAGQGAAMLAVLGLLSALAGYATWKAESADRGVSLSLPLPGPVASVIVVAVLVAGIGAVVAVEGTTNAPPPGKRVNAARLSSTDSLRYKYWKVALHSFRHEPLRGVGSGGFAAEWQRQSHKKESARDAHSLYIETAAELGLVGLALLALLFGGVAWAAQRVHRIDPAAAAGPMAALLTWAVHAGLDWDWEMPAVSGAAILLAAALLAWSDPPGQQAEGS